MGDVKLPVDILLLMSILQDMTRGLRWLDGLSPGFIDNMPDDVSKKNAKGLISILEKAEPLKGEDVERITNHIRSAFNSGDVKLFREAIHEEANNLATLLTVCKMTLEYNTRKHAEKYRFNPDQLPKELLTSLGIDELAQSLGLKLHEYDSRF